MTRRCCSECSGTNWQPRASKSFRSMESTTHWRLSTPKSSRPIRMGILGDNVDRQRIGSGAASTYEERATLRLLQEARRSGKVVSPFGLLRRDILDYLDDDVCRTEAPDFPGWVEAVRVWNQGGCRTPFKSFVTEQFGLRLDRNTVHRLAVGTALVRRVPVELEQVVRAICARAGSA